MTKRKIPLIFEIKSKVTENNIKFSLIQIKKNLFYDKPFPIITMLKTLEEKLVLTTTTHTVIELFFLLIILLCQIDFHL